MNGILVVDKPLGPTSFDVVRRIRALTRASKAGHTGTLDPLATGVLAVCLGEATKLAGLLTEGDKAYDAVVTLGIRTDTLDVTGKVLGTGEVPPLSADRLEAALVPFRGTFGQVPPMFSAVKVQGKRLHALARAGEEVERAPRLVTVHALALRDFSSTEVTLSLRCSKGFFVRSLADALGQQLGCGGCLKALRRTASGPFTLDAALGLERIEALAAEPGALEAALVPPAEALSFLPALTVDAATAARVAHGVPLDIRQEGAEARVRVLGPDGALLAVADVRRGRLQYVRVLVRT